MQHSKLYVNESSTDLSMFSKTPASSAATKKRKLPPTETPRKRATRADGGPVRTPAPTPIVSAAALSNDDPIDLDSDNDVEVLGSLQLEPGSPRSEDTRRIERQTKLREMTFVRRVENAIKADGNVVDIGNILSTRKLVLDYASSDQDIITFVDANNRKLGVIHKALISHYSDHLEKLLLDPSSTETVTQQFVLEEPQPGVFGYFQNWTYDTFKKVDAPHLTTVDFAKLYIFAKNFKIPYLAQDVLAYLFRKFDHEIESPEYDVDTELVGFLKLAFLLGPKTNLAKMAVDRMIKLAGTGKRVKEWYPKYPKDMKRLYDWKIHIMLEEGGDPRPFELKNYLLSRDEDVM